MSPEGTAHFEVRRWNDVVPSALKSIVNPADPALTCRAVNCRAFSTPDFQDSLPKNNQLSSQNSVWSAKHLK